MPRGFTYGNKTSDLLVYEVIELHPGIRTGLIQFVLAGRRTPMSHATVENVLIKLRKEGKVRTVSGGRRIRLNFTSEDWESFYGGTDNTPSVLEGLVDAERAKEARRYVGGRGFSGLVRSEPVEKRYL